MNVTTRDHFEEIDWLDYAQGSADRSLAGEMDSHLAACEPCRRRLDSMRRLVEALPFAGSLVAADSGPSAEPPMLPDFESISRNASARADAIAPERHASRSKILDAFSGPGRESFAWTPSTFEAAWALTRELLREDAPLAGKIARSALSALEVAPDREALGADGLEGVLRTVVADVLYTEGESEKALEELEKARPILESRSRVPEDDLAFWAYVSALALRDLGRAQAALEALDLAERLDGLLEDFPRQARCRIVRAVILADLGRREDAISIYQGLLARGHELEDDRLLGMVHLNLGNDLVELKRLEEAKRTYARAAEILRRTGEPRRLFRIKAGLATIAAEEGRHQESYELALQLREHFRSNNLGWDEILTQLRIVEALLHLDRSAEAAEECRRLLPRIEQLGLSREAARAIGYLSEADLDLERVAKVIRFLGRVEQGEDIRWSAA